MFLNPGMGTRTFKRAPAAAAYSGPGDIVSGALVWCGLRAYTLASIGNDCCIIERASDSTQQTFVTVAGGGVDTAAIATFLTATSGVVVQLHDQTGNGNHMKAITSLAPPYTATAIGSLPGMTFNGTDERLITDAAVSSSAQPFSVSSVLLRLSTFAADSATTGQVAASWTCGNTTSNTGRTYAGSALTGTCSDDAFHAVQHVFNGGSSHLYVDGSDTSGSAGTTGLSAARVYFGEDGFSNFHKGTICEMGIWASTAFDATQMANLDSNQQSYWGF
jgi:hypothetical protein